MNGDSSKRLTQIAALFWTLSSVFWAAQERFVDWPSVSPRQVILFGAALFAAALVAVFLLEGIQSGSRWVWWIALTGLVVSLVIPTVIGVALFDRRWWAWWLVALFGLIGSMSVFESIYAGLFCFVLLALLVADAIVSWRTERQWLSLRTFLLDPLCRDKELYGTRVTES